MANEAPAITLKVIGVVRNNVKRSPSHEFDWRKVVSEIVVDASLTEALEGLEEFSYIFVLFWFHRITAREMPLKIHPMDRKELPLTGLFATGTPNRPNRIGRATVRLLQRAGNVLRVEGLDAIDGTPVLDIKSYNPKYDSITDARVPPWTTS